MSQKTDKQWVGRFAPTPTGPLHFGSLVAALASYLLAKQKGGLWLLRIEDLDPPREVAGAAEDIITTLKAFGFKWDGPIVYQSQRNDAYQAALEQLQDGCFLYACDCSRKQINQRAAGIYDGFCRDKARANENAALRIKFDNEFGGSCGARDFSEFVDGILGQCQFNLAQDKQDFIIRRRDGLYAYQLAVVVDDIAQGVNQVVRGADILDSTPRQNFLYHCFEQTPPEYYHLPLVVDKFGEKLSKRKFSKAIEVNQAIYWLQAAYRHLGQDLSFCEPYLSPADFLNKAIDNFDVNKVGKQAIRYDHLD